MKRQQLDELIRLITRRVLKEYTAMSSKPEDDPTPDPNAPDDAQTAIEKERARREADQERKDAIKKGDIELRSTKAQDDYFRKSRDQLRLDILAKNKRQQDLKAGRISPSDIKPGTATSTY